MGRLEFARAYAAIGWRVHPCRPREKLPILTDWPKRATTDQTLIDRWWGRSRDANIAVATGPGSDLFVLDVDGPEGERSLVDLEHQHGALPDLYPMQWTGSGHGWQAFFQWPDGRNIRNSAGRLGPKLDTRGDGGYVILPPSVHPSGKRYAWATDRDPWGLPPAPAPGWLVDLLDPPERIGELANCDHGRILPSSRGTGDERYLEKAFVTELKLTARAPQGERNRQLYESAVSLLRFVANGRLPAAAVWHDLADAARASGLPNIEIDRTLKSAAARRGLIL